MCRTLPVIAHSAEPNVLREEEGRGVKTGSDGDNYRIQETAWQAFLVELRVWCAEKGSIGNQKLKKVSLEIVEVSPRHS